MLFKSTLIYLDSLAAVTMRLVYFKKYTKRDNHSLFVNLL